MAHVSDFDVLEARRIVVIGEQDLTLLLQTEAGHRFESALLATREQFRAAKLVHDGPFFPFSQWSTSFPFTCTVMSSTGRSDSKVCSDRAETSHNRTRCYGDLRKISVIVAIFELVEARSGVSAEVQESVAIALHIRSLASDRRDKLSSLLLLALLLACPSQGRV